MNWKRQNPSAPGSSSALPRLLLLALFFLCGVILGQALMFRVPDDTGAELKQYLTDYVQLGAAGRRPLGALLSTAVLYLRYPLLAFLLGFASVGVILLPCTALAFGFFLSFSVCCFTAAFGAHGVVLTLAVFGLRCLVTLPCFFLLAAASLETSTALAGVSFGRGRRLRAVVYGRDWWLRFCAAAVVLLLGVCLDLLLSSRLLELALAQIGI